ncbi:MAG: hypothetical protein LBE31_07810 [Deltaproteobacteria bacterium]|jgi:hypothetical protein|nr:hypothetical protein [Deltaproteobacteria bacterium]
MSFTPVSQYGTVSANELLRSNDEVEFRTAQLKMFHAQNLKSRSMDYLDQMNNTQDKLQKMDWFLKILRETSSKAGGSFEAQDQTAMTPPVVIAFMNQNKLPASDSLSDNIATLSYFQEKVFMQSQSLVDSVQQYIGEYDFSLTSAGDDLAKLR